MRVCWCLVLVACSAAPVATSRTPAAAPPAPPIPSLDGLTSEPFGLPPPDEEVVVCGVIDPTFEADPDAPSADELASADKWISRRLERGTSGGGTPWLRVRTMTLQRVFDWALLTFEQIDADDAGPAPRWLDDTAVRESLVGKVGWETGRMIYTFPGNPGPTFRLACGDSTMRVARADAERCTDHAPARVLSCEDLDGRWQPSRTIFAPAPGVEEVVTGACQGRWRAIAAGGGVAKSQ